MHSQKWRQLGRRKEDVGEEGVGKLGDELVERFMGEFRFKGWIDGGACAKEREAW